MGGKQGRHTAHVTGHSRELRGHLPVPRPWALKVQWNPGTCLPPSRREMVVESDKHIALIFDILEFMRSPQMNILLSLVLEQLPYLLRGRGLCLFEPQ